MIWIVTFVLCVLLSIATLAVFFPEIVSPLMSRRWGRNRYY